MSEPPPIVPRMATRDSRRQAHGPADGGYGQLSRQLQRGRAPGPRPPSRPGAV